MSRVIVTKALSDMVRELRIQNKCSSIKVAEHINKSPALISRFESGNIKTIDSDTLYSILSFITNESDSAKLLDKIYQNLSFRYDSDEIQKQLWLMNYDKIKCSITIPDNLVDDINSLMAKNKITKEYLLSRINGNDSISADEINNSLIDYNEWYYSKNGTLAIKLKMQRSKLEEILSKRTKSCEYIFIQAMVYYSFKIEKYNNLKDLTRDQDKELKDSTKEFLSNHHFFSNGEKNIMRLAKKTYIKRAEILDSFDIENQEIINDILRALKFASVKNTTDTNRKLSKFSRNLRWDLGFMLKLISLQFSNLENTSYTNKKHLLSDIEELIRKYNNIDDVDEQIEYY